VAAKWRGVYLLKQQGIRIANIRGTTQQDISYVFSSTIQWSEYDPYKLALASTAALHDSNNCTTAT
jgi:hypothetical protein